MYVLEVITSKASYRTLWATDTWTSTTINSSQWQRLAAKQNEQNQTQQMTCIRRWLRDTQLPTYQVLLDLMTFALMSKPNKQ